jgi:hypothetical protein
MEVGGLQPPVVESERPVIFAEIVAIIVAREMLVASAALGRFEAAVEKVAGDSRGLRLARPARLHDEAAVAVAAVDGCPVDLIIDTRVACRATWPEP